MYLTSEKASNWNIHAHSIYYKQAKPELVYSLFGSVLSQVKMQAAKAAPHSQFRHYMLSFTQELSVHTVAHSLFRLSATQKHVRHHVATVDPDTQLVQYAAQHVSGEPAAHLAELGAHVVAHRLLVVSRDGVLADVLHHHVHEPGLFEAFLELLHRVPVRDGRVPEPRT